MEISPLTGVLGARVDEVELSPAMVDDLVEELHQALCEHEVLVVPGQDLSPAEQAGFSHLLGDYSPVPFVQPVPEHPEVIRSSRRPPNPKPSTSAGCGTATSRSWTPRRPSRSCAPWTYRR